MRQTTHRDRSCFARRRGAAPAALVLLGLFACNRAGVTSQPSDGGAIGGAGGGGGGGGSSGGRVGSGGGSVVGGGSGGGGSGGSPGASGGNGGRVGGASGGDAGTVAGSCTGALLCEDFESYTTGNVPAGPWRVNTNLGTVRVDATHASSGTKAVRFTTDGGTGTFRQAFISIEGAPVFPVPGNVLYGRMMVWLTAAPAGSVHWTNIQGEGPVPNMNFRALSRYGGQLQKRLMANYETEGVASDCWQHSATTIPEGRWTCMEWRFNGPNNEMNFWLDSAPLTDLTVLGRGSGCIAQGTGGNWYSPTYDTIRLGWEHYQQSIAHEMWIDDVALDIKRIGCP